ncbi:MAG: UTP--glucose-1-phosphate uridylyltransferase [Solirubrobacteraceae bacterium]
MEAAGVHPAARAAFRRFYVQLAAGETGLLPESEVEPVGQLPRLDELDVDEAAGRVALDRTAVVKLNGGLGTSMGLPRAKSLLPVKDGLSFLDIIARQVLATRRRLGVKLPLLLMNSFHTRADSLAALSRHPGLAGDLPPDFMQGREPKVRVDDLMPVRWDADPDLEWCPPGHGDVYSALKTSGMLGDLLARGYEYLFLSNADNLGAVPDPRILAWIVQEQVPFLSEQCGRTEADRKGGHLALRDGRLILRETAQTPAADQTAFEDIGRHPYFNINNLWVHLPALDAVLDAHGGVLPLPMIRNTKTVDPADPGSTPVYQLESAMGAAVGLFDGARALQVGRERFTPVKTTDDLLAARSDNYVLREDFQLVLSPARTAPPLYVELDPAHFKLLADFEARFPGGAPSLLECERLLVRGDVRFGSAIKVRGSVQIEHEGPGQLLIPDGAILEG